MENVINIRLALEQLGTAWQFGGSVTDGTQQAWDAVVWEDSRAKPTWGTLCTAHADYVHDALFAALRKARDARLAATDKMLLPDYPIAADDLAKVKTYRAALRDLPDQPGTPWDGGGVVTPWPDAAGIMQSEQPTTQATGQTCA